MADIDRIIFVEDHGNERAIMAKIMFDDGNTSDVITEARGITVLFPEPMNQKVEAVLISNGYKVPEFKSRQIETDDFSDKTLVLTMEERQKNKLIERFPDAKNIQVLTDLTGDELEIMDPIGAPLQSYGLCFESLSIIIKKLLLLVCKGER
ncbi:MAG: phosphotyrosine protein phosphatase [Lachnospiraceae bacterium]|jgi:protein-tyrosine phosphatase|nr:phosphotyrosine protein phosphatase [Lachnospiraceae bacterium]MBQ9342337.1 phosphotyrosine protein phosphatase [Lachnospiraceae bacterium]MBQ9579830.1 phosphotyrosine protein phosphatase [Lachnospiraceae bacterium]MCR5344746.1 phosphotyrosine protein phosphatase [Lachnospiraceae bacterium]